MSEIMLQLNFNFSVTKEEYEQAMMDLLNASEKVYSYEGSPKPRGG